MKKLYTTFLTFFAIVALFAQNQYSFNEAEWYVGNGSDTAYLIIDFQSAQTYDPPSSFLWGLLFNDSISGNDAMQEVDAADMNLHIEFAGGFVDSVALGTYQGKNGNNGFYWGIWSDTISTERWVSNIGGMEMIQPNEYYGLSFTDFAPAIVPDTAVAVNNPAAFTTSDLAYFVGTGSDTSVFVIDFLNGNSFAWGYLYDDSVTAEQMMMDIANEDSNLTININAFLNDIIYLSDSGLAGAPNYWNTWSTTNNGLWYTNFGISEMLHPGDWFGCSYPNYPPAIYPTTPVAVEKVDETMSISTRKIAAELRSYPNPTNGIVQLMNIEHEEIIEITIVNGLGSVKVLPLNATIDLSNEATGIYWLQVKTNNHHYQSAVIKQ